MITRFQTDRRERRDRELVVGLEDPDEQAGEAEQQDDREQDLRDKPSRSIASGSEPVNSGMITPATTIPSAVRSTPSTIRMIQNSVEASLNASRLRPCCSSSVNTGTNAAESAACANRFDIRFGTCEAIVNADAAAEVAKYAATISRTRPTTRESAVAIAKIAVLTRCAGAAVGAAGPWGGAPGPREVAAGLCVGVRFRRSRSRCRSGQGRYSTDAPRRNAAAPLCPWQTSTHRRSGSSAPSASVSKTAATRRRSRPTSAVSRRRSRRATVRGRRRAPRARPDDRQGRQARRSAPKHRRPQEVARGARAARLGAR